MFVECPSNAKQFSKRFCRSAQTLPSIYWLIESTPMQTRNASGSHAEQLLLTNFARI